MQTTQSSMHVDLDATLQPRNQEVHATARISVPARLSERNRLEFWLHRELPITSVEGKGVGRISWDSAPVDAPPFAPHAARLSIEVSGNSDPQLDVKIVYGGRISTWPSWSANVISEAWTELGLYFPWFPHNASYGAFSYRLTADAPEGYEVRSLGAPRGSSRPWCFEALDPGEDLVLFAGRSIRDVRRETSEIEIEVHDGTPPPSIATTIADELLQIVSTYEQWFGPVDAHRIQVVLSPREAGGGYARRGLIVLGGINGKSYAQDHERYVRHFAHELAHLWWHHADYTSWEDWLNESFAEYSALRVIRTVFGLSSFRKHLQEKRQNSPAEAIWGFDRGNISSEESRSTAEALLYSKGPVVLHHLSEDLGESRMLQLLQQAAESNTSTTEGLIDLVASLGGRDVANSLISRLKGG